MSDQIKYYFKEDTNQILVSGSDNKSGMNVLLNSAKDENTIFTGLPNGNNTVLLSSLGQNSTYVIQNNGQEAGDTTITIGADQELWLYRGWQPTGTGILDANAYRYNPHLHRPYKAYILTETGGGSSAFPWSPDGSTPFSNFPGGNTLQISDAYDERYLASNGSQPQEGINSTAVVKGELTVTQADRGIHPWVFTRYTVKNSTRQGSTFYMYRENFSYDYNSRYFTSIGVVTQTNAVVFNNTTVTSITEATLGSTVLNSSVLTGLITNISQGKPAGELVFTQSAIANSTITGTVTSITFTVISGTAVYKVGLSSVTSPSSTVQYANDSIIGVEFANYPQFVGTPVFQQELSSATNTTAEKYPTINLQNALYTYTSSVFDGAPSGQYYGLGFSEFGVYADVNWSVVYQATNDTGGTVRIYYSDTSGNLKYYDLETGFIVEYSGLATPSPYFDPVSPGTGFENIVIETTTQATQKPSSAFNTRVNDVYIAYSSSLSQSIDGLYVFNQIPQSDVQVTVSMFVDAWRGHDDGAKYGIAGGINENTTYSIDVSTPPDPQTEPTYGEGETGDGPTWTTASIRLYTGTYPNAVPTVLDNFLYEEAFESEIIHINGLSITSSYLIPKADISLKTCLSVALQVSTGSNTPASDVENSLVVRNYNIEFNTPGANENDGSVPVMLDDAFSGGDSFKNSPDCQPLYNVVVTDETLRRNPLIQEVEYNVPESFMLREEEELIPFIYPNGAVSIDPITTVTYSQANNQIVTSGNGTGIVLNLEVINNGGGIKITVTNPGSGYQNGDTLSISKAELRKTFTTQSMIRDLLINLNFVYGLYNPSNFQAILANDAIKSSVPESNYTQLASITPRYLGAKSSALNVNSVQELVGGFGTLPVIDYKTAFFAYCDQVLDPYPTVNNQTLFNVKYLINEGGDPKQPNLSPYTAFDIEGSWEEGGVGRVGINQISGSTQYDALNNLQPIGLVAKQIVPYFWSQTGNNSYATVSIPMSGKFFNDVTAEFLQYGMTVAGNLYKESNENTFVPTLGDNFFTSATTTFNTQTFNQAFLYGEYVNPPDSISQQVSHSFVTGSSPTGTPVAVDYADIGEIFFNDDKWAQEGLNGLIIPNLSDSYTIKTNFSFPASTLSPRGQNRGEMSQVGNIKIRLQYLDQPYDAAKTSWESDINDNYTQNIEIDENIESTVTLYFGDIDNNGNVPSTNTNTEEMPISEMGGAFSIVTDNTTTQTQYYLQLNLHYGKFHTNYTRLYGNYSFNNINFMVYNISLKSKGTIPSNRRFRWSVQQEFNTAGGTAYWNKWNPTKINNLNSNNYRSNPPTLIDPPINGPFFTSTITGTKEAPTDNSNQILIENGYWDFWNQGYALKTGNGSTPAGTGAGYAIGGLATTSNAISITDDMVNTPDGEGGTITLTTNTAGAIVSCTLIQGDSSGYAQNSIITIPQSTLIASGLNAAGTGTAIITLNEYITVSLGKGSYNVLELQSETANQLYNETTTGNIYFMGTLPYTASSNPLFPGGQEPSDTTFPELGIPFQIMVGDEIRFLNSEDQVYTIITVTPPSDTNNRKLRVTVESDAALLLTPGEEIIPSSTNLDFFLFRRTIFSPNTIYIDRPFPYGTLPTIKKFVDSTNQSFSDTPAFAGSSYPTQATSQGSGSFIEYTDILRKSDNTPAGILFPEYPTALIDLTPDEILKNLRDNKLIE